MIRSAETIRVLSVVDEYPPSICGIGDYSAALARALADKGVEVEIFTKAAPGLPSRETVDGVAIQRSANGWTWADLRPILRTADELGSQTIVHLQYPSLTGYHRRTMINLLPAMFRTLRRSHPLVVTMHGFHEHRLRWRLRAMPMLWANSAMVFVHPRDCELAARFAPWSSRRSAFIPIASNVPALPADSSRKQRVRAELNLGGDEKIVVYFGEVRPDKGLHTLLDAVQPLHQSGLPVRAVVISTIGTHSHALSTYEKEMLDRLEMGTRAGWALLARAETPQRAAEVLQAADVAAFPFTLGAAENRGSLMAAVVNGLPVLTTNGISTPPDYADRYGVETVPAGDHAAFAARLKHLICCPDERATLAAKAVAVADRFSWSAIADQTIEVYRRCLTA
jgi:glycosyltransferase involved in cell wall biosynthesis